MNELHLLWILPLFPILDHGHLRGCLSALKRIDRFRKIDIAHADATGVMGSQVNPNSVVDVKPLGMVLVGFGQLRDLGHEGERFYEILEGQLPLKLALHHGPMVQMSELLFELLRSQGLDAHQLCPRILVP